MVKLDREVKGHMDKYEKTREKYTKTCHDYEEAAVALEGLIWNKEAIPENRKRALEKLTTLA